MREPIAIVGIGCRFPGHVSDAASFWNLMIEGRSGIREVPEGRWNPARFYHPDRSVPGKLITTRGGFLDQPDRFDAGFFGISPREARRMDPQQRWLLEVAWEALEDGGMPACRLRGSRTGVFVGMSSFEFATIQCQNARGVDVHTNSGIALSIAANRISFQLDLRGPSLAVDTACSSALVALHLACESIWNDDSEMALACGVNTLLTPYGTVGFSKAGMLSPDGECYAFDSRANGFVRGEGAGVIFIKRLSEAIRDQDRIYAVIRSTATNQDGRTATLTVPGEAAQEALLREAYEKAGIDPAEVAYVEAHGTGTPVGDPIEAAALGKVLAAGRAKSAPCRIGSVKTNLGHLEPAAGIAGVIKAALILDRGVIPPNRNFEKPNPSIPFDDLNLRVVTKCEPLAADGCRAVVGVNSFGFGGTNAHAVLEAAPNGATLSPPGALLANRPLVLPLSGRDEAALRASAQKIRRCLADSEASLRDLCYSAGERREHHPHRLIVLGHDAVELRGRLEAWLSSPADDLGIVAGHAAESASPITFVYSGQGGQWWRMGRDLLQREPIFRAAVEEIDAAIRELGGWSLRDELLRDEQDSQIHRTDIAQPAIFALQTGLTRLWQSWGIFPRQVVGHSVGEVAAALEAGILDLGDAVRVIFHRSRLQHLTAGQGGMAAVGVSQQTAQAIIADSGPGLTIAAVNSPSLVTLAGDTQPLLHVLDALEREGVFVRRLPINYAFHSHQMDPIRDELLASLAEIKPRVGDIPFVSTVTGTVVDGSQMGADYWWSNVRQPVRFAQAIQTCSSATQIFLEIGPHASLASSIKETIAASRSTVYFNSLRRDADDSMELLTSLARLHLVGIRIDWARVNQSEGRYVSLPCYPWTWKPYWFESSESARKRLDAEVTPLLGVPVATALATWESEPDPRRFDYLQDHRIWNSIVFPAACFAEMALALVRNNHPDGSHVVEDLTVEKALFISPDAVPFLQTVYDERDNSFAIFSSNENRKQWDRHVSGRITKLPTQQRQAVSVEALQAQLEGPIQAEELYRALDHAGYQFGERFRNIRRFWKGADQAIAEIVASSPASSKPADCCFHPALLDACFQACVGLMPATGNGTDSALFLPASIKRIQLYRSEVPQHFFAQVANLRCQDDAITADIMVLANDGMPVAEILGFRANKFEQGRAAAGPPVTLYQFKWRLGHLWGSRSEGAAHLARPEVIASAARERIGELCGKYETEHHLYAFIPQSEQVAGLYIEQAYRKLGWNPEPGTEFNVDDAMAGLGAIERYRAPVCTQLDMLARHTGALTGLEGDCWRINRAWADKDPESAIEALRQAFPMFDADANMIAAIGPRLADILGGIVDPLEVLFPGGSSELIGAAYRRGADFPAYNDLLQTALATALKDVPERRAIRILEVGEGTGSLTRAILPILPSHKTEYTFTDFSTSFLVSPEQQFPEFPFVKYQIFDIERPPGEQGLSPAGFDIVLASNALHATTSIAEALEHLKECLAPGGLLIFLEPSRRIAGMENTFGLVNAWWRFRDHALRANSSLLSPAEWRQVLLRQGFKDVTYFVNVPREEDALQAVYVAKVPPTVSPPNGGTASLSSALSGDRDIGPNDRVLIFADRTGVAAAVAEFLRAQGVHTQLVMAGRLPTNSQDVIPCIDPASEHALDAFFDEHVLSDNPPAAILNCWSLDPPAPPPGGNGVDRMNEVHSTLVHHLRRLLQSLARRWPKALPKLLVATRGAQSVLDGEDISRLDCAPIVGLLRVARNELPETSCRLIDLEPEPNDGEIADLVAEMMRSDNEGEVAYRQGRRHVHRLQKVDEDEIPVRLIEARGQHGIQTPYRLELGKPGSIANISLHATTRKIPGPDELEVEVKAAGINFRDLMKVLGMYPGNPIELRRLGDDFAGIVTRVGANVSDIDVGDPVYGLTHSSFSSHVLAHRRLVTRKPETLTFADAATLPTVFLTAHYALVELARMQPGERLLIHAAAGGVGQAAIQIANALGLEIFATAGTPEKRELVRSLGASHVMDSRSLRFADEVMAATAGEGVDAVLNSLSGDFIPKSLSVLAPFGRMLEIGKVDIYANHKIGLAPFRNNISFCAIDLAQHMETRPAEITAMFQEVAKRVAQGEYRPLPHRLFPVTEAAEALRFMAQGKHVGKVVLHFDHHSIPVGPATEDARIFQPDAFYLITGGASGVGLEMARWMALSGARHLALLSRSGPPDQAAAQIIAEIRDSGAQVHDLRGDVTSAEDVRRAINEANPPGIPLRGIFHCAMVISDGFITELDEEQFNRAFVPKSIGAWNLHSISHGLPLDFFVCFSSISATLGASRQANYNAGNCFLGALMQHRHAHGLSGLAIDWGAIHGAGFVARDRKVADYLDRVGLHGLALTEVFEKLRFLLSCDTPEVAVAKIDWTTIAKINPQVRTGKIFEPVSPTRVGRRGSAWVRDALANAASHAEAREILVEYLASQVAEVLGTDAGTIGTDKPLDRIGLDSLMAVELVHRVESDLDLTLPMGAVLSGSGLADLAESVLRLVRGDADTSEDRHGASLLDPMLETRMLEDCHLADSIHFPRTSTPHATNGRILVTGATGFLGAFVLTELLQRENEIVCLVRAPSASAALNRINENLRKYRLTVDDRLLRRRIRTVAGDLGKPRFGLEEQEFRELAASVGSVYHLAAAVDHQASYDSLRDANVLSARHLLEFAAMAEQPPAVHYASTLAVFSKREGSLSAAVDERTSQSELPSLPSGYVQSKWVAEHLFQAARERGCPVTIYRLGLITGDQRTGTSNTNDFLWRMVKSFLSLGIAPNFKTPLCLTPVDFAAQALVALSLREDKASQTYHILGDNNVSLDDVMKVAETFGRHVEHLPGEEWIDQISQYLNDQSLEPIAPYLLAYPEHTAKRILDPVTFPAISSAFTDRCLAEQAVAKTINSHALIRKYLDYLVSVGFLQPHLEVEPSRPRFRQKQISAE